MEDTNVASVTVNAETVLQRVMVLHSLFNEIETKFRPALDQARAAQTLDTWTDIPACTSFRSAMAQTLVDAERRLGQLWAQVGGLCTNLQESAAALDELDAVTSDALTALMTRADAGLPEPVQVPLAAYPPYVSGGPLATTPAYTWPAPSSPSSPVQDLIAGGGLFTDTQGGTVS